MPLERAAKSKVLLISDCMPDGLGSRRRARAWQWLRTLDPLFEVHVVCLEDAPIHMEEWRAARQLARRLIIAPAPNFPLLSRYSQAFGGLRGGQQRRLLKLMREENLPQKFDGIVYTHPALAPCAQSRDGGWRVCDCMDFPNPWEQRLGRQVLDQGDALVFEHEKQMRGFPSDRDRAILLPLGVDRVLLNHDGADWRNFLALEHGTAGAQISPWTLLQDDDARTAAEEKWWLDQVVHRLPEAPAAHADQRRACGLHELQQRDSSRIVAIAGKNPAAASWFTLAALAMGKAVIAHASALEKIPLRHGEHLFLAHGADDWVRLLSRLMTDAPLARRLAHQGQNYIWQQRDLLTLGQDFTRLAQPALSRIGPPAPLARAA